jgi:type-F conjugative transfer system pilin assembly protein TrbC
MLFIIRFFLLTLIVFDVQACCKKQDFLKKEDDTVLVLVSFSMPDVALKALSDSLKTIKGKLVFRGLLDNSFKKTQLKLLELGCEAIIDPLIFRDLQVKKVPVFVIGYEKEGNLGSWISGNISLYSALDILANKGHGQARALQAQLRRNL